MRSTRGLGAVVCCVVLIAGLTGGTLLQASLRTNSHPSARIFQAAIANIDWHNGTAQSTPEVDVSYTEQYSTITAGGYNTTQMGLLSQLMVLSYNDGTGARVEFEVHCVFNPGGLDITNQQVLNWTKLNHIELILHSEGWVNGTWVGTMYSFQGFDIVSGNASQVSLSRVSLGNGTYSTNLNNVIGFISYWTNTAKIGNVILSTVNYSYQGNALKESVAHFNVTIDSEITTPLRSQVTVSVPTVLTFQVTHNVTQTTYKYGASIDWSTAKAFPTYPSLGTGQSFSLVAHDLLMFNYGINSPEVKQFSTDARNDTAIYLVGGKEMCRELFTTQYTIEASSQVHNTTRIYVKNAWQDGAANVSSVFVVFDGFNYNESTGLKFDPAVVTPNSVAAPLALVLAVLGAVVGVIAADILIFTRRKRKKGATSAQSSKSLANEPSSLSAEKA